MSFLNVCLKNVLHNHLSDVMLTINGLKAVVVLIKIFSEVIYLDVIKECPKQKYIYQSQ